MCNPNVFGVGYMGYNSIRVENNVRQSAFRTQVRTVGVDGGRQRD
jgi:hypothetical protein